MLACAAVLIGAATHVLWDGFTHRGGWAVARFPALLAPLSSTLPIPRYWIGQIASSVVGVALVLLWAWRAWRSMDARLSQRERSRLLRVVRVVFAGAALGAAADVMIGGSTDLRRIAGRGAVGGMDGAVVTVLALGVLRRRGAQPAA